MNISLTKHSFDIRWERVFYDCPAQIINTCERTTTTTLPIYNSIKISPIVVAVAVVIFCFLNICFLSFFFVNFIAFTEKKCHSLVTVRKFEKEFQVKNGE